MQEPIRCNKCQEYWHIRGDCPKEEHCANCTNPHPTSSCTYPNEHHCISCGSTLNHTSSDRGKCSQFTQCTTALDVWSPKNSLPYFPVLGSTWTFVLAAKNMQAPAPHRPQNTQISINVNETQPAMHNLTQTTIGLNGQLNTLTNTAARQNRPPDKGWQSCQSHQFHDSSHYNPSPNDIPLPHSQQHIPSHLASSSHPWLPPPLFPPPCNNISDVPTHRWD